MIRVFIVEDNQRHLATLQAKVLDLGYSIAGTSNNSHQALKDFHETTADVVLMDINLDDDDDGIVLASKLKARSDVPIIFTTAMAANHIVQSAINTSPSGYLVKPINPAELKASIELATIKKTKAPPVPQINQEYLTVRLGQKLRKIHFEDISYIKVDSKNYVTIVDKQKKNFAIRGSLKKLLDGVLPKSFLRTHHSHVINLAYVEYIDESTQSMYLSTGEPIPIGRIFKKEVYNRMNIT